MPRIRVIKPVCPRCGHSRYVGCYLGGWICFEPWGHSQWTPKESRMISQGSRHTWDWPQDPSVGDIVTVLECSYSPEGIAVWLYAERERLNDVLGRCALYAKAVGLAEGVMG